MQHSSSYTHHSAPSQLFFRLKPLTFDPSTSSSLDALSTSELALAWIAPHPDWKDHLHWAPMVAKWKRRRAVAFKAGAQPVKEVKGDADIELQSLAWDIAQDHMELHSVRLATLPIHPYFDPSLAQRARSIFQSRRVGGLSATSEQKANLGTPPLTPPASLSPRPSLFPRSIIANAFALVPLDVTRSWEVVLIHAIDGSYPLEQVRQLVSPPFLPPPVAVKLVSKQTGLANRNICFVAYEDRRDAVVAAMGLRSVVCPAGSSVRHLETTRSTSRGGRWEWYTTSEAFIRRGGLIGKGISYGAPFNVVDSAQTTLPPTLQFQDAVRAAYSAIDRSRDMRTSFSRPSSPPIAIPSSSSQSASFDVPPSRPSPSKQPAAVHFASPSTADGLSTREHELREALQARKRSREQQREKEKAESAASSLPHKPTLHHSSAVPTGPRNRQIPSAQPPTGQNRCSSPPLPPPYPSPV